MGTQLNPAQPNPAVQCRALPTLCPPPLAAVMYTFLSAALASPRPKPNLAPIPAPCLPMSPQRPDFDLGGLEVCPRVHGAALSFAVRLLAPPLFHLFCTHRLS